MPSEIKSFCIVCVANYCRSPVIERLLKDTYDNHEFYSAGLSPMYKPEMDKRSRQFLNNINISSGLHLPKKLNLKMLKYFDVILAVDLFVLSELNKKYPKFHSKFKLFNSQFPDYEIRDPYKMNEEDYSKVMSDIHFVAENIDLNLL